LTVHFHFLNKFFKEFPAVKRWIEKTKKRAEETGQVETMFGRVRRLPDALLSNQENNLKSRAMRQAINMPIQGTAADIIKLAICFADSDIKKAGLIEKARLVMQIHDELVYEVEEGVAEQVLDIVRKAMEGVLERSYLHYKTVVPLSVSGGVGPTLYDLK
jgi:DNA polymerase-1